MSELKYIKFFEKFESNKLSKTLGFINSESKSELITEIKKICDNIDFPYSNISDEYFEYLSFTKALNKSDDIGDEPCIGKSQDSYPNHAVDGSTCEGGQVKRTWGRSIRLAKCEVCGGTGNKPKNVGDIKLIKFWFDKDGQYITSTAVDGVIRPNLRLSTNINNYDTSGEWLTGRRELLNTAKDDDYALIVLNDKPEVNIISKLKLSKLRWSYSSMLRLFAVQNVLHKEIPEFDYDKIADCVFSISDNDNILKSKIIYKKDIIDPYTWNVSLHYNGQQVIVRKSGTNIEKSIKDAHFALILDFGKLKKSEYNKHSVMKSDRKELKSNSKLEWSDESIKKQNIERYLKKIASNMDITNISNLNRLVNRAFGYKYILYVSLTSNEIKSIISKIIELYYRLMTSVDDINKEYYLSKIEEMVRKVYKSIRKDTISRNLIEIRSEIEKHDNWSFEDKKIRLISILDNLDIISSNLYDKMNSIDIESIDDLEILDAKAQKIFDIFYSDRYDGLKHLYNFFYYIDRSSTKDSLYYLIRLEIDDILLIERDINRVFSIIKKI
jgi:hypothetical protein